MTKKLLTVLICVVIGFLAAFGHYVHRGYVNVLETGDSLKLLRHGFHLRAPWHRVTAYPLQCREFRVEILEAGPDARIHFDAVLYVSVSPDSVIPLHNAYGGAFVDSVVSPMISSFLMDYGDAYGLLDSDVGSQKVTGVILDFLGREGGKHGINVTNMWLRSYEAERTPGTF